MLDKGTEAAVAIICRTDALVLIPLIPLVTDDDVEAVAKTRMDIRMLPAPVRVLAMTSLLVTSRRSRWPELDVSFTELRETRFGSTLIAAEIIA